VRPFFTSFCILVAELFLTGPDRREWHAVLLYVRREAAPAHASDGIRLGWYAKYDDVEVVCIAADIFIFSRGET
jgi:hypothetical protein